MKTLKESLLGDIESNFAKGADAMNKLNVFGCRFKFSRAVVGSTSAGILSLTTLKKLTNGMSYMSDKIEKGLFDKQGKIKMLANLIDHLTSEDLGIDISANADNSFRKDLTVKLGNYIANNDIFSGVGKRNASMWVVSVQGSSENSLDILFTRNDKISNAYTFRLYYTIEKI